jgi:hypothetical protein
MARSKFIWQEVDEMTPGSCGCSAKTCGCCEGSRKLTPADTANRPGLEALQYRVGTHGTFFETMKARLATMTVAAPGADGQTIEIFQTLRGLTTRNESDPSIALLDGWATVGDILTFYQERIANEGYLRTATERRSILELARLVGYALRPGVSATAYLAYTLDEKATEPAEIPVGARSQSVPGPGETAQSFETSDPLIARSDWNNLQVRLSRPQNITVDNVMSLESIYVAGTNTNLTSGDRLLLVFGAENDQKVLRTVVSAEGQFEKNLTEIRLQPVPAFASVMFPAFLRLIESIKSLITETKHQAAKPLVEFLESIVDQVAWGDPIDPTFASDGNPSFPEDPEVEQILIQFWTKWLKLVADFLAQSHDKKTTEPSKFVGSLLKPRIGQVANSLQLDRKLELAFADGADGPAQILVNSAPELKDSFYVAWSNANVETARPTLTAIYAFRMTASLFGATVPRQPSYFPDDKTQGDGQHFKGQLKPQSDWDEWKVASDENDDRMFLDHAHKEVLPESYVLIETFMPGGFARRNVRKVAGTITAQRSAYGLSGQTTQLSFAKAWWKTKQDSNQPNDISDMLRRTLVYGQSEELTLVEKPILDPVGGKTGGSEIELGALYHELTSGRWIILSGERADIPGVTGVKSAELLMISNLRQDFDKNLPGDKTHTTLILATPAAYRYKRETLTIYGNVVKATHGETRNEPLGSGDGSQAFQSFDLKQPPLTFVPAPIAAGVESTLHIFVNNIEWHETDSLAGLKPKDRAFITETDDDDKTTVVFGNGSEGSRLPTGVLNVNAVYRNGIGKAGNVKAEQISLLQTRPLGVNSVINPLRASGGADKESRDQARENAPLAVMSLDRLVSLQDYADFTRTFAGIAKASARLLTDGHRRLVHLTIAGADDIPIDGDSDLYRNLLLALRELGSDIPPVQVDMRELVTLVLAANVGLLPDYQWEPVATEIRASILDRFGFQKRALGQPALVCEIIAAIQQVEGVAYVDVDSFGGVPEKTTDEGSRRLLTLSEISEVIQEIISPPVATTQGAGANQLPKVASAETNPTTLYVPAELADYSDGVLHPAQLAVFSPSVQDTIVLNQIT